MFSNTASTVGYTQYTVLNLLATGAVTRLEFVGRQDDSDMGVDTVSVVQSAAPPPPSGTPAPTSILLIGIGLAGMGLWFERRGRIA